MYVINSSVQPVFIESRKSIFLTNPARFVGPPRPAPRPPAAVEGPGIYVGIRVVDLEFRVFKNLPRRTINPIALIATRLTVALSVAPAAVLRPDPRVRT